MHLKTYVTKLLKEHALAQMNEDWYHGTSDSRDIEALGGFNDKITSVEYVLNPIDLKLNQERLTQARSSGNMELYHKLLDNTSSLKKTFTYNTPLFLSDVYSVAKTYADPKRAFDYQGALEKVYKVETNCNRIVKIVAIGDRFRFINIDKVKKGFIDAGVPEETIDTLIEMFNFYVTDNKGIKTDTVAAIGNYLNFDCIDVVGVLDSYQGGTVKSTVRMVLNPSTVKILTHQ
jgi:hypothetical protein